MTVGELQQLLIAKLLRASGGTARRWARCNRPYPGARRIHHTHCNWEVHPSGSTREVAEIERLLDTVRLDHPIVSHDVPAARQV